MIDIQGIDKIALFQALYENARVLVSSWIKPGHPLYTHQSHTMGLDRARDLYQHHSGYFNYIDGRALKVDLNSNTLDSSLYNALNGEGLAERVIQALNPDHPSELSHTAHPKPGLCSKKPV